MLEETFGIAVINVNEFSLAKKENLLIPYQS